jgi:hypothetical protein
MDRHQYFAAAVAAASLTLFASDAFAKPSFPTNQDLAVPWGQDLPICYIQYADGSIRGLSKICGFISPSACKESLGSPERDGVLKQFCEKNKKCLLQGTCNQQAPAPYGPPPGTAAG